MPSTPPVVDAITPASITATTTVSSTILTEAQIIVSGSIVATTTVSGGVHRVAGVLPAGITSTTTVSGTAPIPAQIISTGMITATSSVSGSTQKLGGALQPQIAADQSTYAGAGVTSLEWAHTVPAGTNRLLIVSVCTNYATNPDISSVTYGGVALTALDDAGPVTADSHNRTLSNWYMIAPPVGSADIIISFAGTVGAGAIATNVTNARQTSPFGSSTWQVNNGGGSGTQSLSISSEYTANLSKALMFSTLGWRSATGTPAVPGTGQTPLAQANGGSGSGFETVQMATQPGVTAGVASSWTWTDTADVAMMYDFPVFAPAGSDAITPATISATSTVAGGTHALRRVSPGTITTTTTISSYVGALRKITPATITATATVSGREIQLKRVGTGTVTATTTVSGALYRNRAIVPSTAITATTTVSGSFTRQHKFSGTINVTNAVSGAAQAKHSIIPISIVTQSNIVAGGFSIVHASAPTNSAIPSIAGSPTVGSLLTGSVGTWVGTGITFGYQWVHIIGGIDTPIPLAVGLTYAPAITDVGYTIEFQVMATNAYGSLVVDSLPVGPVTATPVFVPNITIAPPLPNPAVLVPHFDLPFRFTGTSFAVVEQDSAADIANCVQAIIRTPVGWREELPSFGVPDQSFSQNGVDVAPIIAAVQEWEPRASIEAEANNTSLDEYISAVILDVQGGT